MIMGEMKMMKERTRGVMTGSGHGLWIRVRGRREDTEGKTRTEGGMWSGARVRNGTRWDEVGGRSRRMDGWGAGARAHATKQS